MDMPSGDILVFLTGQEEIESLSLLLQDKLKLLPKEAPSLLVRFSLIHSIIHSSSSSSLSSITCCRFTLCMQLYRLSNNLWSSRLLLHIPVKSFSPPTSPSRPSPSRESSMWWIPAWWRSVWVRQPRGCSRCWSRRFQSLMLGSELVVQVEKVKERFVVNGEWWMVNGEWWMKNGEWRMKSDELWMANCPYINSPM